MSVIARVFETLPFVVSLPSFMHTSAVKCLGFERSNLIHKKSLNWSGQVGTPRFCVFDALVDRQKVTEVYTHVLLTEIRSVETAGV